MAQKRTASNYNRSENRVRTGNSRAASGGSRAYVNGNTVRRLDAVPERVPEKKRERELTPEEQRALHRRQVAARQNRQRAEAMTLGYTMFLLCAALICALFVGLYVHLQSQITTRMEEVGVLQEEVADLEALNDALEARIESSISLDAVKETAIGTFGMQYPDSDQIITYSVESSDYMNQYSSVE